MKKNVLSFVASALLVSTLNADSFNMDLKKGWNLKSIPVNKSVSLSELGELETVFIFKNNEWKKNEVITTLNPNNGFWIKAKSDRSINFEGDSYTLDTSNLSIGWNLLGAGEDIIVSSLNSDRVFTFNSDSMSWSINPSTITRGKGFWIKNSEITNLKDVVNEEIRIVYKEEDVDTKENIVSIEGDVQIIQELKEATPTKESDFDVLDSDKQLEFKRAILATTNGSKELYLGDYDLSEEPLFFITPYENFTAIPSFNNFINNNYIFVSGADIRVKDKLRDDITNSINSNSTYFNAKLLDSIDLMNIDDVKDINSFEVHFYQNGIWSKGFDLTRSEIEALNTNSKLQLVKKFKFAPFVVVAKKPIEYWKEKQITFKDTTSGTVAVKGNDTSSNKRETNTKELIALKECKSNGSDLICNVKYPAIYEIDEAVLLDGVKKEALNIKDKKEELNSDNPVIVLLENDIEIEIIHQNIDYGTLKSPYTGRVWLDRNLGANRVCIDFNDKECYGDYYQWGRGRDGHEKVDSINTDTVSDSIYPSHSDFIVINGDWSIDDIDGFSRSKNWSKKDGTSICPIGFRVPTFEELSQETIEQSSFSDNLSLFNSFLKIPTAGFNNAYNGNHLDYDGQWGYLWTTTVLNNNSKSINFSQSTLYSPSEGTIRAQGLNIRCIKDDLAEF